MERMKLFDRIAEYKVRITNDYSKFKILDGNREIERIGTIKDQIKKYEYLWIPILVNEFYEVIDGQHRLEACKVLNVPVHYIVQPGLRLEHCQALNIGRRNWSTANYIHAGAIENSDYSLFEILTKKHPSITRQVILSTYDGTLTGGNLRGKIARGDLTCSDKDFAIADATCYWLDDIAVYLKKNGFKGTVHTKLMNALVFAYKHRLINKSELKTRMLDAAGTLKSKALNTGENAVTAVEDIYNVGRHKANRVDILSDYRAALNNIVGWKERNKG